MAGIAALLQQLRILMAAQRAEGQGDAQLLEQFVSERDEAAFAGLLERHGPMVLGVCRRILHDEHQAEDAFQATFLVLVRNASAIRKRPSIASWLHGVALRLAQKAKADAACANRPDARNPRQTDGDGLTDASWHETRGILDEELQRLPDNYRLPLVLCYLEGKTRDEAAAQLGWTTNQLRGHLERGRTKLQTRLLQRGVTLSVAAAAPLLTDALLAATVPPLLAVATLHAATRFAAGATLSACGVSGSVVALTQGGLKMMASKKLIAILAVALFAMALGSGIGIFGQRTEPAEAKHPLELPVPIVALKQPVRDNPKLDRFGDPLPPGAIARLGTMRFRHPFWVAGLAYTPDGKTLAAACWDGTVRLWDADTGKETHCFRREPNPASIGLVAIVDVAITPDGKSVIALDNIDSVRVWDIATGKERMHLKGHAFAFALSADGKTLAKGANGGQVSFWNLETGVLIRTVGKSKRTVSAVTFSRDGALLASCDGYFKSNEGGSVHLWDPTTGRKLHELKGHTGGVTSVAFSPDGKLLASASHDNTIRLWRQNGQLVRTILVPEDPYPDTSKPDRMKGIHFGGVLAVVFSPDGRWIASGSYDGSVRLWDAGNGKALHKIAAHGREASSVLFSPDGKVLASGGFDHSIRLWDPATGKEIQPREGHRGQLKSIAISPDGKVAAVACADRSIHLWSLESRQQLRVLRGHKDLVYSVTFSVDGRNLASGSADDTIRIWDVAAGRETSQLLGHEGAVYSVAFTPINDMLLSVGADKSIRFWDWSSAKEIRRVRNNESIFGLWLSRNGRTAGAQSSQAILLDVATGKEFCRISSSPHLAIAPDGNTCLTLAADGHLQQWNVATGKETTALNGPGSSIGFAGTAYLAYSPDGRLFAAHRGYSVELWEIASGKMRRSLIGHQRRVNSFSFSPDGRTMLTGGEDTTVLIWDLARRHEAHPVRLTPADLDALWRDLGGDDAERADRAIGTLTARAEQSVPYLDKHLAAINAVDPKRLTALIGDLDSAAFAVRDKAAKELQGLRGLATSALKEALAKSSALETRRRIEELLAKQRTPLTAGALLQSIRAVEVLERVESAEARRVLRRLASGAPLSRVTQEAQAASDRMGSSRSGNIR